MRSLADSPRRQLLSALVAIGLLLPEASATAAVRWARYEGLLAAADSMQRTGAGAACFALLDSLDAVALQRGDAELRMVATLGRGRALIGDFRADSAEVTLRSALTLLRAQRDTIGQVRSLRLLGRADEVRGRMTEARAGYEASLALARRAHASAEAGWVLTSIGSLDFDTDRMDQALADYRRALKAFASTGDWRGRLRARAGLARTLTLMNRTDEARREHARVLDEARRRGDRVYTAETLTNLGVLEHMSGDPAKAAALYGDALSTYRQLSWTDRVLRVTQNLALLDVNAGRYDVADSLLMGVLPDAERSRNLEMRARILCQLGVVRREQKRFAEALSYGRRAVAYTDSIPAAFVLSIIYPLLGTLEDMNRPQEALALIDEQRVHLKGRVSPAGLRSLEVTRAQMLRRLGRSREALEPLREAAKTWTEIPGSNLGAQKLQDLSDLARCYREVGELDSALVWFGRISERWEAWRGTTTDPAWREKYDEFARRFTGDYAATLLDSRRPLSADARACAAFDALQRFRARTLSERISDPAAGAVPAPRIIEALAFRQSVLQPGEVFVDLHALPDTTLVFVMTRDAVRAYWARRENSLFPRLARFQAMLADPAPGPSSTVAEASAALGAELLGPAKDLLAHANRVIIAGGTLGRFALDQLALPGEHEPLLAHREVTWIPSASLLADARASRGNQPARAVLSIAQSQPLDGVALRGAKREAQWLAQQFARSDVMADASIASAGSVVARAPQYQVLHFAVHTRSGGKRHWQDALRVGAGSREDAWLTAARIARLRLPARLCVLAGCATVGGGNVSGETQEGLATAWLAAGARTVLATRWAVDDDATFELMRRLYGRLARGETVGVALRAAQLEMRGIPRYSAPYYWAGVVLLGDPDTRVSLSPRPKRPASVTSGL